MEHFNENQSNDNLPQEERFPWMEVIVSLVIIIVLLILAWT